MLTGNQAVAPRSLFASDVLPLEYMNFTGKYKSALQKTGNFLPIIICFVGSTCSSGRLCAAGRRAVKNLPLATTHRAVDLLIKPYNEELLDQKRKRPSSSLEPVVPAQTSPVTYRIQVFEVLNKARTGIVQQPATV